MPSPLVGMIGASVGGSLVQASAANRAAQSQEALGREQLEVQERMFEQSREDLAPYRESGLPAVNALNYYLGVGARPDDPNFVGFQETPGFLYAMDQGRRAVDASAAARGGLFSGATIQAQTDRAVGMANQEFGNYLSRLEGTATRGQNAAAQSATVNTNNAQMQSNTLGQIGNAQAAGAIGVGNAINGGIQNGIGLWQYQNMLNRFPV